MLQPRHASRVPRPRLSRLRSRPVVATVALVATVGLISGAAPAYVAVADGDISLSQGDRVLQSVDIEMGPDGTLNSVVSNAVAATSDGSPSDTSTDTFSPDDVVDDLPVRVVTSYRTADGAGTDLSELKGYTGKVAIDLTVQNLTVTPKDISYDVDGGSRSQAALVGVPLTVVASTTLPDVPGASVVTAEKNKNESTNGVLSQSQDGTTQVQWATILAPPQLGSSARLSLVVDAKDFTPPSFDLSVQPGLVTDTSVGALVESVFDPEASDELALQARTIKVIGEVNEVLGRAGASIGNVRTTLNASAETLGQKTVGDLESSVTEITSSMRDLDGTITGLGDDLSSTLESTGSSSIEQLQESVANVDKLLGDTSATALPPRTSGNGCDVEIGTTGGARTVFGSLLRVGGRLQAFADATEQCKGQLQRSIADSIGPAEPSQESCLGASSVTCSIFGAASSFAGITQQFVDSAAAAKETLQVGAVDSASTEADELLQRATALRTAVTLLNGNFGTVFTTLDGVKQARSELAGALRVAGSDVSGLTDSDSSLGVAKQQNLNLANEVCPNLGVTNPQFAYRVLGFLVPDYPASCPAAVRKDPLTGEDRELTPPAGLNPLEPGKSIAELLEDNESAVNTVVTNLNPDVSTTAVGAELAQLDTAIAAVETALGQARDGKTLDEDVQKSLGQIAADTYGQAEQVAIQTGIVEAGYDQAITALDAAVAAAQSQAENEVTGQIQEGIRRVTTRAQENREDVGKAFDKSRAGLDAAARDIVNDGRATVRSQRDDLTSSQKKAADSLGKLVDDGLVQIAGQVRSSTRDNKAVTTLLTADLTKVLQDIGESGNGGSGLLGSLATNAATAGTADFQVALATRTTSSYANVRGQDIAGILLRQAQSEASLEAQASMAAFGIDVPSGVERRTVYTFHVAGQ